MTGPAPVLNLEPLFAVGSLSGPVQFGRIVGLALSSNGILAVADGFGCTVQFFDAASGKRVAQSGRCGQGPGEFGDIVAIGSRADTFLVVDEAAGALVRLGSSGDYLSTEKLPDAIFSAVSVNGMESGVLLSPRWQGPTRELLMLVEDDGRILGGVPDSELSYTNGDKALVRYAPSCALRKGGRAAAANWWAPQIVIVDSRLRARYAADLEGAWFMATPSPTGREGWWLPRFHPAVACGDNVALWRYRVNDNSRGRDSVSVERGLLHAATGDGKHIGTYEVHQTAWPDPTSMTPGAILGDTIVYFFDSRHGPYPSVRAYRLSASGVGTDDR